MPAENDTMPAAIVIGAGPAGLMAADVLSGGGVRVDVYDAMPSPGRKFLLAGVGGMNLTHAEPRERFGARYGARQAWVTEWLAAFGPDELRAWAHALGIETFVGSSGRVFPRDMKAAPLLRAWLQRLRASGVRLHVRERWLGSPADGGLRFGGPHGEHEVAADAVVLALGGGSRSRLGSDGAWLPLLARRGVSLAPLRPSNCGFDVAWSPHFREKLEGQPVKSVVLSFGSFQQQGEFIITKEGVEGSLIYAASGSLRDEIEANGKAVMMLDLAPDHSHDWLVERLSRSRGSRSMASHLEKSINIKGVKAGLLREFVSKEDFSHLQPLAHFIKNLPIPLIATRPLDEAISSAGGVMFEALDEHLMLKSIPGVFCAGEMLDWEAPTGGYLLTACFASGYVAGHGVLNWLGVTFGISPVQQDG